MLTYTHFAQIVQFTSYEELEQDWTAVIGLAILGVGVTNKIIRDVTDKNYLALSR